MIPNVGHVARARFALALRRPRARIVFALYALWVVVPGGVRALHPELDALGQAQARFLTLVYDLDVARRFAGCSPALALSAVVAFYAIPLVTLALVEAPHPERFTPPASRAAVVVGGAAASLALFVTMTSVAFGLVALAVVAAGGERAMDVLAWWASLVGTSALLAAAYVSVWTLTLTLVRTYWRAVAFSVAVALVLGALRAYLQARATSPLAHVVLPGMLDGALLSGLVHRQVEAIAAMTLWSSASLLATSAALRRRLGS